MKILYLAHRVPYPPNKGDKLRSFHQIDWLSRRHTVWCACFVDSTDEQRFAVDLWTRCEDVAAIPVSRTRAAIRSAAALAAGGTATEAWYREARMRRLLQRWSEQVGFDAVVAFSSSMAQYALQVRARRRVLDLCDRDSQKWLDYAGPYSGLRPVSYGPMRWVYRTEGRRLARREQDLAEQFDATILITEAEAAGLRAASPPGKIHVIGNGAVVPGRMVPGIGVDPFSCGPAGEEVCGPPEALQRSSAGGGFTSSRIGRDELIVGFVGAMDYRPNADAVCWFARECWGRIRAAFPRARFRIVGRHPARSVRQLEGLPGVVVVGEVAEIGTELARFDVSVAPMRIARGLQNKVIEAMAFGKPVVLSSAAATGLSARHGPDLIVADSAEAVIREVCRLLADVDARRELGASAKKYVETTHRWEPLLERFEWVVTGVGPTRTSAAPLYSTQPEPSVARESPIAKM